MDALLINPPARVGNLSYADWVGMAFPNPDQKWFPFESLGLMSIKAHAAQSPLDLRVIDGIVRNDRHCRDTWAHIRDLYASEEPPVVVGISSVSSWSAAEYLLKKTKRAWPSATTVLGNSLGTLLPSVVFKATPHLDYICKGEGEGMLSEILRVDGTESDKVSGLIHREAGPESKTEQPRTVDVNSVPWPDRSQLLQVMKLGFAPGILTSRGCPYQCTYCGTGSISRLRAAKNKHRERPIKDVVNEVRYLVRDFDISHFTICDDLFVTKSKSSQNRAIDFASQLIDAGLTDLQWMADVRVDSITRDVFECLYKAGLRRVFVGIETADRERLRTYRKHYGRDTDIMRRLETLEDVGIDVVPGMITWHPDVTPSDVRRSVALLDAVGSCNPTKLQNRLRLYPGTALWKQYRRDGKLFGNPSEDIRTGDPGRRGWVFTDPKAETIFCEFNETLEKEWESAGSLSYEYARDTLLEMVEQWERLSQ